MKKIILLALLGVLSMNSVVVAGETYIQKKSQYSVSETLDRLESILKNKEITVFSRVNHSEGAKQVGLQMQDTQLLIFGNPKLGTPLMNENILMALDLPMKVLAYKDDKNQVWLSYLNPSEFKIRHNLKNQAVIDKMTQALDGLTNKASGI